MAGSAKLSVQVIGDAASAKKALAETGAAAEASGSKLQSVGSKVGDTFKETLKAFVPMAAAFGAADFAKEAIDGAENLKKAQDGLAVAIQHTGGNVDQLMPKYDAIAKSAAEFGVNQIDATQALQKATVITGNAASAQRAYQEALVISKATGIDLNAALLATSKAQEGVTTSLQRYGIAIAKGTPGQEQYNEVMKRFGGQAEANTSASDKLRASFDNLQTNIGTLLLPAFDKIVEAVNKVVTWFMSPQVSQAVHGFVQGITGALQPAIDWVRQNWPEIERIITQVVQDAWTAVKGVITVFKAGWREFGGTIKTIVRNDFETIKGVIEGVVKVIRGVVEIIKGIAHGNWALVWKGIKDVVGGTFQGIAAILQGAISNFAAIMAKIGHAMGSALAAAFKGAAAAVKAGIDALIIAPINEIIKAIDAIKLPAVGFTIFGHHIGFGGWGGFKIPEIPYLAEGGIVTSPTLAMIGEAGPEAVVPLNRGGLGGVNVNVTVHGWVGSEQQLAQKIGDALATGLRGNRIPTLQMAIQNI